MKNRELSGYELEDIIHKITINLQNRDYQLSVLNRINLEENENFKIEGAKFYTDLTVLYMKKFITLYEVLKD